MRNSIIKNKSELEFAVFCIENIAIKSGASPTRVYDALTKDSDILNNYIVPCYDVLHTQGKEYIVNDILDFANKKGIII